MPDNTDTIRRCLSLIHRLPQARVLHPDSVRSWLLRSMQNDPERVEWHLKRAGGIGGSEIGSILDWASGNHEYAGRETAEAIGKAKLLLLPPGKGNDDTARGIAMEPIVRSFFEARLTRIGAQWRRRPDIQDAVESARHPDYPWLRASLDGVYEIDGEIHIVDFKAPSAESLDSMTSNGPPGPYVAQLNHYALVASSAGIQVDRLSLIAFDYKRAGTTGVAILDVGIDRSLQHDITAAGDVFWNDYVLAGLVPRDNRNRDAGPVSEELEQAAQEFVVLKALSDQTKAMVDTQRALLKMLAGERGMEGVLAVGAMGDEGTDGLVNIKANRKLDIETAVARLRELGWDETRLNALRRPTKDSTKALGRYFEPLLGLLDDVFSQKPSEDVMRRLDVVKKETAFLRAGEFSEDMVTDALVESGETLYVYQTEAIDVRMTQKKRQDMAILVGRLEKIAENFADDTVTCETRRHVGLDVAQTA